MRLRTTALQFLFVSLILALACGGGENAGSSAEADSRQGETEEGFILQNADKAILASGILSLEGVWPESVYIPGDQDEAPSEISTEALISSWLEKSSGEIAEPLRAEMKCRVGDIVKELVLVLGPPIFTLPAELSGDEEVSSLKVEYEVVSVIEGDVSECDTPSLLVDYGTYDASPLADSTSEGGPNIIIIFDGIAEDTYDIDLCAGGVSNGTRSILLIFDGLTSDTYNIRTCG